MPFFPPVGRRPRLTAGGIETMVAVEAAAQARNTEHDDRTVANRAHRRAPGRGGRGRGPRSRRDRSRSQSPQGHGGWGCAFSMQCSHRFVTSLPPSHDFFPTPTSCRQARRVGMSQETAWLKNHVSIHGPRRRCRREPPASRGLSCGAAMGKGDGGRGQQRGRCQPEKTRTACGGNEAQDVSLLLRERGMADGTKDVLGLWVAHSEGRSSGWQCSPSSVSAAFRTSWCSAPTA